MKNERYYNAKSKSETREVYFFFLYLLFIVHVTIFYIYGHDDYIDSVVWYLFQLSIKYRFVYKNGMANFWSKKFLESLRTSFGDVIQHFDRIKKKCFKNVSLGLSESIYSITLSTFFCLSKIFLFSLFISHFSTLSWGICDILGALFFYSM